MYHYTKFLASQSLLGYGVTHKQATPAQQTSQPKVPTPSQPSSLGHASSGVPHREEVKPNHPHFTLLPITQNPLPKLSTPVKPAALSPVSTEAHMAGLGKVSLGNWHPNIDLISTSAAQTEESWGTKSTYYNDALSSKIKETGSIIEAARSLTQTGYSSAYASADKKLIKTTQLGGMASDTNVKTGATPYRQGDKALIVIASKDRPKNKAQMLDAFQSLGYPTSAIKVLEMPSSIQLKEAIKWAGSGSGRSTLYFHGHGATEETAKTRQQLSQTQGEGSATGFLTLKQRQGGKLFMSENHLASLLKESISPDRQVLMFIDACHSGSFVKVKPEAVAKSKPSFWEQK
jgi:hypothetical protein